MTRILTARLTRVYICLAKPNWCKWRLFGIEIHFACIYNHPHFASKPSLAKIDFLRQGERLVDGKGTHNVKFLTENQTKTIILYTRAWATARKTHTLTTARASGCWTSIKSQDDFIELKIKSSLIHSRFYLDFLASLASDTLCNIFNFTLTYK